MRAPLQAKDRRRKLFPSEEIVSQIVSTAVDSCLFAESIVSRIAQLNPVHKKQVYMFLTNQEYEEASLVPSPPQKELPKPDPTRAKNSMRPSSADLNDAKGYV